MPSRRDSAINSSTLVTRGTEWSLNPLLSTNVGTGTVGVLAEPTVDTSAVVSVAVSFEPSVAATDPPVDGVEPPEGDALSGEQAAAKRPTSTQGPRRIDDRIESIV